MDGNDISGAIDNEAQLAVRTATLLDAYCTHPRLAVLLHENLPYIDDFEELEEASMLAAVGDEVGLMKLLSRQKRRLQAFCRNKKTADK